MRHAGYELSVTGDGRGEGLFATRRFKPGEVVVVGAIERRLPENHSHATQVGIGQYVLLGGFGSKVNHSCDPNCGVRVNASGAPDLVARRNIEPGEEITFDYAMRNYSIEHFPSSCLCGAAGCRRTITGWKDLPPDRKAAYQGLVAPYLLNLEQETSSCDPDRLMR
ncbi:MAG TPA: SET domain-containing protein-lysine N-methyltransferase, partial [Actinomycetota bacterium]|nr:SET domain-containing protein-lysine N-methyltransferase [Actinomycetota bacterium]